MEETSLQHHGIRGMKWGVRRYQNSDGTLTEAGKKRYAKELAKVEAEKKILKNRAKTQAKIDKLNAMRKANEEQKEALGIKKPKISMPKRAEKPQQPKKKTIKDLSDEELQARINRLRLENDYRKLVSDVNPQKVSAGEKFFKEQILPKATKTITDIASDYATKKAKELLGMNKVDPMDKLKKEAEAAGYMTKIIQYKNEKDKRDEDLKRRKKDS